MAEVVEPDWTREHYPISWLPYPARLDIADYLDAGGPSGRHGIEMFAYHLGISPQEIETMKARCLSPQFKNSVTMYLFADLDSRQPGFSIQDIYRFLIRMQSAAADVIIRYLPDILRNMQTNRGQPNTEPSICPCQTCVRPRDMLRTHIHGRLANQSDDRTLGTTISSRNTRFEQTSDFQNGQTRPQHPQSQPSWEAVNHQILSERYLSTPGQYHRDIMYPTRHGSQSVFDRNALFRRTHSVPPDYQQHTSYEGNSVSWIQPDSSTAQSMISDRGRMVQCDSSRSRHSRTISEPTSSLGPRSEALSQCFANARNACYGTVLDANSCEGCRLAADSEQTIVLTPYSQPNGSCSLHFSQYTNHVSTGARQGNHINEENPISNQNLGGRYYADGLYGDIHEHPNNDGEGVRQTNYSGNDISTVSRPINIKMDQTVPKMITSSPTVIRQISNVDSDNKQTARKSTYLDDWENTARKISVFDEHTKESNCQMDQMDITARKTSYLDDCVDMNENTIQICGYLDSNDNKPGDLNAECPMCIEENQIKQELKSKSLITSNIQSSKDAFSCTTENRNCLSNPKSVNKTQCCNQCQSEVLSCATGQCQKEQPSDNNGGEKTSGQGRAIYKRIDERHSWHEGQIRDSRSSLSSSQSDSSIQSWGSSHSTESCSKPIALVTFSKSDDRAKGDEHMKEILDLIERLKKAGIRVRVDMDINSFNKIGWNRMDWLDKNLKLAKYVIACISPEYAEDIIPVDGAVAQVCLNTRYIYDYMRKEFYDNQSRNRRLVPVLFPNSGAQYCHVPQCMTATTIYEYSQDLKDIVRHIKK